MTLTQKIESYLFALGGTATIAQLATLFDVSRDAVGSATDELMDIYQDRGIRIMRSGDDITMGTMPAASEFLADLRREELSGPLSRGAMETLSIILYHQGITKPEIDYLRGVNSQFMIRNLMVRGLIEKIANSADKRAPKYGPTLDTLKFLGVTSPSELPEYDQFMIKMGQLIEQSETDSV